MRLILARHGQSMANVDPEHYSGMDSLLTSLGERQAECLGQWLKDHESDIDLIMCSTLRRARQTAEIVNKYLNLPIVENQYLNEVARAVWPYLPSRKTPFEAGTLSEPDNDGYYRLYRMQVQKALDELTTDPLRPNPILVISHWGTNATLLRLIFERPDMHFTTYNTAMHMLHWKEGRWIVRGLNQTPHLTPEMIS